ncbi:ABC1 family protein [Smittium mucronatum]|uniref:ABC1 family protein n=1 Tax=Smittium mucronatum TaxID=133383 RepID=A0A1R0H653_9FUNG|nr:ABC1 family protein [Smittium mucronatum]
MYIKFGQGIGLQGTVLPPQFTRHLSQLFDNAPAISREEVMAALNQSFPGKKIDDLFIEFSIDPVASASIAQVHKAILKSHPNEYVAVKIQKPSIKKQMEFDLLIFRLWCRLMEYKFEFPIMWTVPYTEKHFRMETNFYQEARNSELAMNVIQTDRSLKDEAYVPKVFWDYTTKSILVTEWIDGLSLVDPEKIKKMGWNLTHIMETMVKVFAQQLFVSGHLHGDPHPGNIIVRQNPNSSKKKAQMVLLDHGLYINESETFRKQYCMLFKSIFLQDTKTVREVSNEWGIKDSGFFSSFILFRPPDSHIRRAKRLAKSMELDSNGKKVEQTEYDRQMNAKGLAIKFFSDSSKLPPELIFVMRNMNMVRSNNKALGSPVNRIKIMAEYAAIGASIDNNLNYNTNVVYKLVNEHKMASSGSNLTEPTSTSLIKHTPLDVPLIQRISSFLISYTTVLHFRFSLFLIDLVFYYTKICNTMVGWITMSKSKPVTKNFEVVIDQAIIASLEDRLGYKIDPDIFNS